MTALQKQLAAECNTIADRAAELNEADFSILSNCPPWTIKDLVVHIGGTIRMPRWKPSQAEPMSAVAYYQRTERETSEYRGRSAEQTQLMAAKFAAGSDAVAWLRTVTQQSEAALNGVDLTQVVQLRSGVAISVGDYLVTRIVSVAVHGIDVAISLDIPWFTTPDALRLLVATLEELVGSDLGGLGWSEDELILWGTGRAAIPAVAHSNSALTASLPVIS